MVELSDLAKMIAEQFLSLDPKERKRLAGRRALERRQAEKVGGEVPPTLGEQFGLSPKRKDRKTAAKKKVTGKGPSNVSKREEERQERVRAFRESVEKQNQNQKPARKVPTWRTICGLLHCTGSGKPVEYVEQAKKLGVSCQIQYFNADKYIGTLYVNEFEGDIVGKIRAVLTGANPGYRLGFRELEKI